jgi:hypothetical protein
MGIHRFHDTFQSSANSEDSEIGEQYSLTTYSVSKNLQARKSGGRHTCNPVILSASTAHIIKIIKLDYPQDAATHVGYAERNSASEMVMHSVHTPAVTHPVQHKISSPVRMLD